MEENVLNKVDDLVDTIKSSEEYQRYLVVSKSLSSNTNVMNKIKKIKKLQKEIINLSSRGEDITSKDQEINTLLEWEFILKDFSSIFSFAMESSLILS